MRRSLLPVLLLPLVVLAQDVPRRDGALEIVYSSGYAATLSQTVGFSFWGSPNTPRGFNVRSVSTYLSGGAAGAGTLSILIDTGTHLTVPGTTCTCVFDCAALVQFEFVESAQCTGQCSFPAGSNVRFRHASQCATTQPSIRGAEFRGTFH